MNRLATTSLDTAASGATPKKNTRTGVISAPPPIPVMPTTTPTTSPATAIVGSHQPMSCSMSISGSGGLDDHPGAHGRIRGLVDQDETAGRPVDPVGIGEQRRCDAQLEATDLVERQR